MRTEEQASQEHARANPQCDVAACSLTPHPSLSHTETLQLPLACGPALLCVRTTLFFHRITLFPHRFSRRPALAARLCAHGTPSIPQIGGRMSTHSHVTAICQVLWGPWQCVGGPPHKPGDLLGVGVLNAAGLGIPLHCTHAQPSALQQLRRRLSS